MFATQLRGALALLASTALLLPVAAKVSLAEDAFSSLNLSSDELSGSAAVKALGNNLSAVAAQYGKTGQELRQLLLKDKTLKMARNGRLYYKEAAPNLPRSAPASNAVTTGQLYPLDQTFNLHSKPGAPKIMVLRFRGATITGTYWNTQRRGAPIVATAYDTDNAPATFSDAERTNIQQIWQRVAEDYAQFDVDVTTDDTVVSSAAPSSFASVVITRQRAYGVSAPGVAFTSTFGNPAYEPAFVAFDSFNGNGKYIAEAISHELGHRLGLDHDGNSRYAYYSGHGSGSMTWAPIMGNSYAAKISQFSKGEYNGANNRQDDFAIMSRFLSLRVDDAGRTAGTAIVFPATASGGTSRGSFDGVLERNGDEDVFTVTAGPGAFTASVTPAVLSPDADLVLTLLDQAGAVIATANPGTTLDASISANLASGGVYYIKVNGTGYGNAATNGYSNYGSRGNYRLTASYPTSATTAPTAVITASTTAGPAPLSVNFSAANSTPAATISGYAWDFGNGYTSTQRAATARFDRAGRYTVQLKVSGAPRYSNATTMEILVGKTFTANIVMARNSNPDGTVSATAVTSAYIDSDNRGFRANKIYGTWSGAASADVIGTGQTRSGTNFTSPAVRNANACLTFTVTKVDYTDTTNVAPEETAKPMTYYPANPITATSCAAQQAAR